MSLILQRRANGELQAMATGRVRRIDCSQVGQEKKVDFAAIVLAYDYVLNPTNNHHMRQFIEVRFFREKALYASNIKRGDDIFVAGKLKEDEFKEKESQGEKKYYIEGNFIVVQPLVFPDKESVRKRRRLIRQGYEIEYDSDVSDYKKRDITEDLIPPGDNQDYPF